MALGGIMDFYPEWMDEQSRARAKMVQIMAEECLTSYPIPGKSLTIEDIEYARMQLGMINWDQELKELGKIKD